MLERLSSDIAVDRRKHQVVIFGREYQPRRGQKRFSEYLVSGAGIVVTHDDLEKLVGTLRLVLAHDSQ